VKTVYDTIVTINLVPYAAMTRDGRYGFVVGNSNGVFVPDGDLNVIDLSSRTSVIEIKLSPGWLTHRTGSMSVEAYASGFQGLRWRPTRSAAGKSAQRHSGVDGHQPTGDRSWRRWSL
jgi:hypothetical protein